MLLEPQTVCSASLYSFHAIQAAYKPFSQLPNHSVSFQTIQPALKPFGLVSKWEHFALYNQKWANQFKNWMTGL